MHLRRSFSCTKIISKHLAICHKLCNYFLGHPDHKRYFSDEILKANGKNCSYYLGPSINYIIFHLDQNAFHLSHLENFLSPCFLRHVWTTLRDSGANSLHCCQACITPKLVRNTMWSVCQRKIWAHNEKNRDKISHNPASTGETPRFRHRSLMNTVIERKLLS